jgi:uncharacterized protein YbbC (DUF1343 family)
MASATFAQEIRPAAEDTGRYLPLLQNKEVALVVNHASAAGSGHLVDLLLERGVHVAKIFAPEHGFRGMADAGEHLKDGIDPKSGLPIVSLYGKHKKPGKSDLEGIGLIVFDIQDVGVRFYTYLSTLHYVMEAAAENGVPVIVLDRPNPNANRIDGPLLKEEFRSFVGLHPVPILYGMTIGEYAMMINGEGWLANGLRADLKVITMPHYSHSDLYHLPIKPSPNLPNDLSIALYPSLALFEGTTFSAGRGTTKQFQLYGDPCYGKKTFSFIPEPREGAKYPKHERKVCYGVDLSGTDLQAIRRSQQMNLAYLLDAYRQTTDKERFFLKNNFFDRLAGNDTLRRAIVAGKNEQEIRAGWEEGLKRFKKVRQKYLLYP